VFKGLASLCEPSPYGALKRSKALSPLSIVFVGISIDLLSLDNNLMEHRNDRKLKTENWRRVFDKPVWLRKKSDQQRQS